MGFLGKCWDFGIQSTETDAWGKDLGENNGILGKSCDLKACRVGWGCLEQ